MLFWMVVRSLVVAGLSSRSRMRNVPPECTEIPCSPSTELLMVTVMFLKVRLPPFWTVMSAVKGIVSLAQVTLEVTVHSVSVLL